MGEKRKTSRRGFLKRTALSFAGIGAATFGYAWRIEPHWIQVVRRNLPISLLPERLIGKTLIQITDLHVGPVVDEDYITGAMRKVSELEPDILAITGDFMTCHGAEQVEPVMRVLKHLKPARLATIGILGNHDYAWRWSDGDAAAQLARSLPAAGIMLLRNQKCDVEGLQIAGVDDLWGTNFHPVKAMSGLDPNRAALVLCHNPDAMDLPVWGGYRGWILAGHTHGGQCKPPFFDAPVIPVQNRRYTSGEFDLFDGRRLYINRGLGYLHRVRFNARPEITVFTLNRATV